MTREINGTHYSVSFRIYCLAFIIGTVIYRQDDYASWLQQLLLRVFVFRGE